MSSDIEWQAGERPTPGAERAGSGHMRRVAPTRRGARQ